MFSDLPLLSMLEPWMLAVAVVVVAVVYLRRDDALDAVVEQWEWLAIFGAGAYLGWFYGPTVMDVVPL